MRRLRPLLLALALLVACAPAAPAATRTSTAPAAGGAPAAATAPATTPAPGPTYAPSPAASDGAIGAAATSAGDGGDAGTPLPLVLLAVLAGLMVIAALLFGAARWWAWDPRWLQRSRHAGAEAGWRAGAAWEEFTDWLRFGR